MPFPSHYSLLTSSSRLHRVGSKFDRIWHDNPFLSGSLQSKTTISETKKRREFLSPFFSKAAISRAESDLHGQKLQIFLDTLDAANNSIVNFYLAFRCLTADLVMDYCFRSDLNALSSPRFENETLESFIAGFDLAIVGTHFPRFFGILNKIILRLPNSIRKKYFAPVVGFQVMQSLARERVEQALTRADQDGGKRMEEDSKQYTMFDSMARPDTERGQVRPSKVDMVADGCLMIAAGSDTTANTMGIILWNVTQNPDIEARLLKELEGIMGLEEMVSSAQIEGEEFQYLHAVVKEALRLSYGVPGPLMRKVPKEGVRVYDHFVPGGVSVPSCRDGSWEEAEFEQTVITASIYMQNADADTFPDPFKFDPERWLCDHKILKERESKMLSFSRGSRSCIGMK